MSKFKIGDRVVYLEGQPYTGTISGTYSPPALRRWVKWDNGTEWGVRETNMEIIPASQKTYPIDLINEYLAFNDMDVIEPLVFDKWVTWKQKRLESLKESVAKMQQEISALEAQLK